MRKGREGWVLCVLLLIFVVATAYFSRRDVEAERRQQPTTYSYLGEGLAGLYQLLGAQGLEVHRWERDFTALSQTGLLVMAEPMERAPRPDESAALWRWVEQGGAVLVLAADDAFGRGQNDLPVDRVVLKAEPARPADVQPKDPSSPYMRDVERLHVDGSLRIEPHKKRDQHVLLSDSLGGYAVVWKRGRGTIIVASEGLGADNAHLTAADNAVFFTNIAQVHRSRAGVLFDEYHQGYGTEMEGRSLWRAIGPTGRAIGWYLLFFLLLVIYNANRRFGTAKELPTPTYRPSTEYISSMAGLYRRAGAGGIAVEAVYNAFLRDLVQRIDAPPGAPPERVAEMAARRFGLDGGALRDLLTRCDRIAHGDQVAESEMLRLARQIEEFRRKADLVRIA